MSAATRSAASSSVSVEIESTIESIFAGAAVRAASEREKGRDLQSREVLGCQWGGGEGRQEEGGTDDEASRAGARKESGRAAVRSEAAWGMASGG